MEVTSPFACKSWLIILEIWGKPFIGGGAFIHLCHRSIGMYLFKWFYEACKCGRFSAAAVWNAVGNIRTKVKLPEWFLSVIFVKIWWNNHFTGILVSISQEISLGIWVAFCAKNTEYCVLKDTIWRCLRMKGLPKMFSILHAVCSSTGFTGKTSPPKRLKHVPSASWGCFWKHTALCHWVMGAGGLDTFSSIWTSAGISWLVSLGVLLGAARLDMATMPKPSHSPFPVSSLSAGLGK